MIHSEFPTTLFIKNRHRLSSLMEQNALAVFHSNDPMPRNGDIFYPYRQNSDMYYLSGIIQESSCLILFPDHPEELNREILFIPDYDEKTKLWEGEKISKKEASEISGIPHIEYFSCFDSVFSKLSSIALILYYNKNENPRFSSLISSADTRFYDMITERYPSHRILSVAPLMTELRLIKEPEEVTLIKKSCAITKETLNELLRVIKPGISEHEIEAHIHFHLTRHKAQHAFLPIVASGINSCTLHYIQNNRICHDGDMLLIDFGAEYSCYASDCTRTIPVNGQMTPRQRSVYQATLDVLNYAKSIIKPGNSITYYHEKICQLWIEKHIELGLYKRKDVKQDTKDIPVWFRYYMHGTSHFIGLDVHDAGEKTIPLQPGMVISCEPAIYIKEENLGIRLENDLLITENGNLDLTENIPVEIDEIETLMKNK